MLGAGCLAGRFRRGAWSGGFDETAAPPSNGLTAEHERTRKPASRDTKVWRGVRPRKARNGFVSAEGGFRAFSCSAPQGRQELQCLSVSAPPEALPVGAGRPARAKRVRPAERSREPRRSEFHQDLPGGSARRAQISVQSLARAHAAAPLSTSRFLTQRRRDAEASLDGPAGFPGFGARGEATVETPLSPRLRVSAFNSPSREGKGKLRAARLPLLLRRMGGASRPSFALRRRRGDGNLPLNTQKRPSVDTEGRVPGAGCGGFG